MHQATGSKCCYCQRRKSKEIHHAYYKDLRGIIKGREKVGESVFPVCLRCHTRILHSKKRWHYGENPVWDARNDAETVDRLRFGYELLSKGTV